MIRGMRVRHGKRFGLAAIYLSMFVGLVHWPQRRTQTRWPPGVTPEMEQDFLARYEAVLKTAKAAKDPSGLAAYYALIATDPSVAPEAKKAFENLAVFPLAMEGLGPETAPILLFPPPPNRRVRPLPWPAKCIPAIFRRSWS